MHVRASACRALPVCELDGNERLAFLETTVVNPDSGHVEGFIVRIPDFLRSNREFLSSNDIAHWGLVARISHRDLIGPLDERLRLQQIVRSGRTVLGQPIVTEGGRRLGRCRDLQFETHFFQLEWLFPRSFFRWGVPVAARDIVEVRADAIVVKDRQATAPVETAAIPAVPAAA
jgi:hypothetical protein